MKRAFLTITVVLTLSLACGAQKIDLTKQVKGVLPATNGGTGTTGAAGGDLGGTYPNPSVGKVNGEVFDTTAPANDDAWCYSSSLVKWVKCVPGLPTSRTVGNASAAYGTADRNKRVLRDLTSAQTDTVPTATTATCGAGSDPCYPDGFIFQIANIGSATITLQTGYTGFVYVGETATMRSNGTTWEKSSGYSGLIPQQRMPTATATRTSCATDVAPVAGDDNLMVLLNPATAIHITRFSCGVTGTTSVVTNLTKASASLLSDQTCTAGDANQVNTTTFANGSGQCGGTSSCAVAAHAPVTVHVGTISGTPTSLAVCVDYTVD